MAKRRSKKRTHPGANNPAPPAEVTGHANPRDPKSMVIRIGAGAVGTSVSQLAADVRRVMEPGTASRLRERKANRLRDYVTMCGPLGVTHLLLFSRAAASGNTHLRLAVAPRGPTFFFRVEAYALCKDVRRAQRHPKGGGKEYITPPLLVMNNFSTPNADAKSKVPKHLESLTTTAFQSLFPPINPTTTPLKSIRRVLLLNREPSGDDDGSFILNFRHYAITTKRLGLAKPLRRLDAAAKLLHGGSGGGSSSSTRKNGRKGGGLPNLAKLQDIADYMLGGEDGEGYATDGGTSGSEMDTDAEIEVLDTAPRKVLSVKARAALAASKAAAEQDKQDGEEGEEEEHDEDDEGATERRPRSAKAHYAPERDENVERRGVRLVELGPRMRLRMLKVEEGMCSGKVLWHEYLHKSPQEVKALEQKWEQRRRDKEARKKQQKENVEKKRRAKEETKKAAKGAKDGEGDVDMEDAQSDDYDDYEDVFDSEGLEGDAEEQANARMEEWGGVGG